MEKINLKNKYFLILFLIFLLSTLFFSLHFLNKNKLKKKDFVDKNSQDAEKIGWITDLHADKKETVEINNDEIIYSTAYREYLPAFFEKLKSENVETVIITGDMTNDGEIDCARSLKEITDNSQLKILWVHGNHDRESTKIMEYFGINSPYYYYFDTKKTRIVILNLTDEKNEPDKKQLLWLKEKLTETNLDVIIAMHVPIIDYDKGILLQNFEELDMILHESSKVKLVISGSLHKERDFFLDGIQYKTGLPFTLKNHEGSYYLIERNGEKYEIKGFNLNKIN